MATEQKSSKGEAEGFMAGATLIALGTSAIAFSVRSGARVRREQMAIRRLWAQRCSVGDLRKVAEKRDALPPICFVTGHLRADGPSVLGLTQQIPSLQPLLGRIDQPQNLYVGLANAANSPGVADRPDLHEFRKQFGELPRVKDDYSKCDTNSPSSRGFVLTELLLTRLSCDARKKTTRDCDTDKETVEITREARAARYVVHHHRANPEGLHLIDLAGEEADINLPRVYAYENRSPPLFMSLPDPMQEFRRYTHFTLLNPDRPFTHFSDFIFIDQSSVTDDGQNFSNPREDEHVLDAIGNLSPDAWMWDPEGFYDNNKPIQLWARWPTRQQLKFKEFKDRLTVAAELNAKHQPITEYSQAQMEAKRDEENCFRIVELGIPRNCEVAILAKPSYQPWKTRPISLNDCEAMDPSKPWNRAIKKSDIDTERFEFMILKGSTIKTYLKKCDVTLLVYFGFGVVGASTVLAGEELIRRRSKVKYA